MTLQYKLTVKGVFLTNFNSTSTNRFNVPNYLSRAKCLLSKQCKWGLFIWNWEQLECRPLHKVVNSIQTSIWTSSMHADIKGSHNTMQQHSGQWYGSIAFEGLQVCKKQWHTSVPKQFDLRCSPWQTWQSIVHNKKLPKCISVVSCFLTYAFRITCE